MGYLSILRSGRTRALWGSQALSVLGDRIFALAVMWMVWSTTGSAAFMGLIAIAESIPFIVIGVVGRRLMQWARTLRQLAVIDAARAVLVGLMPLVFTATLTGGAGLLTLVFLLGVLTALFDPSLMARLPREIDDSAEVTTVYGLFDLSTRVARIAGPALAGTLLAIMSNQHLLWINAATFGVSAIALWFASNHIPGSNTMDSEGDSTTTPEREPRVRVRLRPELKAAFVIHGATIFGFGAVIALPALLAANLAQDSPAAYGIAMSAFGLGAVLGNPVASRLVRRVEFSLVYGFSAAILGSAIAAIAVAPNVATIGALMFAAGVSTPFSGLSLFTFVADTYDESHRQHVLTTDQTVIRTTGTIGVAVFPALASLNPFLSFGLGGALIVVVALTSTVVLHTRMGKAPSRPSPFNDAPPTRSTPSG